MSDQVEAVVSDMGRFADLRSTMGSFWTDAFASQSSLTALLRAKLDSYDCSRSYGERLADCRSRLTVPDMRYEPWWQVTFDPAANRAAPRYGDGTTYGDGTVLGVPVTGPREQFPGGGFLGAPIITDVLHEPTSILVEGLDYREKADGSLVLVDDVSGPYWAWDARFDDGRPYLHAGSIAGLSLPSSARALALYNAVIDASINGPSRAALVRAVEALAGFDVEAGVDGEVVEDVSADARGQLIITDRSVYRVPAGAVVAVAVDQALRSGDSLSDAVRVVDAPDLPDDVTSVTVPASFLDPSLVTPVVFARASTALVVDLNVSGKTRLSWAGAGAGATAFFDLMHARGVASGSTLASYLDVRPLPRDGEPTAASLPATVSPLSFLADEFWRGRMVTAVLVKSDLLESPLVESLDDWTPILRRMLPPHAATLVIDL
jgi:hypothetical protein